MKFNTGVGVLLVGVSLMGCAGLNSEYVHRDGWRPGTVKRVGNDREMIERVSPTCANASQGNAYVMIQYTGNSHLRWRSFPLPEGVSVKEGNKVDLNV